MLKNAFICSALFILIAACGTSNYRSIQFQKEKKSTDSELSESKTPKEKNYEPFENTSSPVLVEKTGENLSSSSNQIEDLSTSESIQIIDKKENRPLVTKNPKKIEDKISTMDYESEKNTKFATLSAVFGGLSFIPIVGWVFSILAIVFGSIALYKARHYPDMFGGSRKAITGIILGGTSLIIGATLVYLIFFVL